MDEWGLPRKSIETSGSSDTARIPFSGPAAAALNAALMPSALVGLSTTAARSTTETVRAGTPQVLVGKVEQLLIVRVRVDGGHPALHDPELVVEHLGERRQAVGRARGVGDDVVRR